VISDNTWTHAPPANPGAYTAAALSAGVSAAHQEQLVANHKEEQVSYTKYLGAQEAGKELILYDMGNDALAPPKKQYSNFGDVTVYSMIKHLYDKTEIKMTTSQKYKYKTEGYRTAWDPTMSITAYFTGLDRFQISLDDRGILTSIEEKTMVAGAHMWESKMFTEDQMVAWENKPTADQTWDNLQTYFTEKWLKRRQYLPAMAKQLQAIGSAHWSTKSSSWGSFSSKMLAGSLCRERLFSTEEHERALQFLIHIDMEEGETWSLMEVLVMSRFSTSIILSTAATMVIFLLDVKVILCPNLS
jgi:hypothetical protein